MKNSDLTVLAALLFGAFVLVGCTQQGRENPTQTPAASAGNVYAISGTSFPARIEVASGTTVTWRNDDSEEHQLVFAGERSPTLAPGESWSKTFNEAGTFGYHCAFHATEAGKVFVS